MRKLYFVLITTICVFTTNAQIINIPDANFKATLLSASPSNQIAKNLNGNSVSIDTNGDGEISQNEALQIGQLSVIYCNISDLTGIHFFQNLTVLNCAQNVLTQLDVSALTSIVDLNCMMNQLTVLNINGLTNLSHLNCSSNHLTNLNVSNFGNLNYLYCHYNQIQDLPLNGCNSLQRVYCYINQLTSLDASGLSNLTILMCDGNPITSLNLSGATALNYLKCNNNLLTELNINDSPSLNTLYCNNNLLERLFVKTGNYINYANLNFNNNPALSYICTDADNITTYQTQCNSYGYTNCAVNSYCSFVPGGQYFAINGYAKFDLNNDGCDANDLNFPFLKYSVSDGVNSGMFISNQTGNYSIAVQAGTHTVTPIAENPSYFSFSPAAATVSFPATTSPYVQNFCASANGIHDDLEVILLPLGVARPGFDAHYKLIYKNKGTRVIQSTIYLNFNDSVLDLSSATPAVTSQSTGALSWDFINLMPLETREILFTMSINSPTETPAVNSGDILQYTAAVLATVIEENAENNQFNLNQTVRNSLDPNDKTCLEGNGIAPEMIGNYVHYMIRFENTGTFPAQNIVVRDDIDATKFDISTLVPEHGSHPFVTRITGNKVEFIFENINLPFDDANNDGYVAFKIKTKPTLVEGDTFSNTANIYFDYNFPVTTNTSTTTIQTLGISDFDFGSTFSLSPVPTKNVLNITAKESVEISSESIYNTLGQLVQVSTGPDKTIDVSALKTGTYFIKITSDKGTASTKFIKE